MRAPLLALIAATSVICLSASRCSGFGPGGDASALTIVAYNAHNVFDAVDDGDEYSEFSVARGRWDEGRYKARLAGIAKAVGAALPDGAWPDVLCLEEIENRAVLEALAAGPLKAAGYSHIGIAPASGSPINSGILSRKPILALKAHGLAASEGSKASPAPPSRALLEARIDCGGGSELSLFVVHWKSKVEGPEATEGPRREAAALIAERIARILDAESGAAIVVCGDFNESPDEYFRVGRRYPTALMADLAAPEGAAGLGSKRLLVSSEPGRAGRRADGEPLLYSPWTADSGYSYAYKGGRERLDGFLLSAGLLDAEGLVFRGFAVVDAPFLLGPGGEPLAWSSSSGSGYSDHLPILLILEKAAN